MENSNRRYYNEEEKAQANAVPIKDVCTALGIEVGRNNMVKIRDERTASAQLHLDKNTWHDFGTGRGGDVIGLVMEYFNCNFNSAISFVATVGGLDFSQEAPRPMGLTNAEWAKLDISGDIASKNFDIDFRTQTLEEVKALSDKGNMSVNEFKKQHPKEYEDLLYARAIPYVERLREDYFEDVYSTCCILCLENGIDWHTVAQTKFTDEIKELWTAEALLRRAEEGTDIPMWKKREYNPEEDINHILFGKEPVKFGHMDGRDYYVLKHSTETKRSLLIRYVRDERGQRVGQFAYRGRKYEVTKYFNCRDGKSMSVQHQEAQQRIDNEIESINKKEISEIMETVQDKRREAAARDASGENPVDKAMDALFEFWEGTSSDEAPAAVVKAEVVAPVQNVEQEKERSQNETAAPVANQKEMATPNRAAAVVMEGRDNTTGRAEAFVPAGLVQPERPSVLAALREKQAAIAAQPKIFGREKDALAL